MKASDVVKNAPNSLIYTVGAVAIAFLAAYVILSLNGSDTAELWTFLNRAVNVVGAAFAGGGLIVAGAAAKSAQKAEQQTNGLSEAERQDIAERAVQAALATKQNPIE